MKAWTAFLAVLMIGVSSFAFDTNVTPQYELVRVGLPPKVGPGDFFPWGKEVPFPWSKIQGIYRGYEKTGETFYFFNVRVQNENQRILEIWQIDSKCRWTARGAGFEYNKVVRAVVANQAGKSFELTVQAFNAKDIYPSTKSGIVTVMSKNIVGMPRSREDFVLSYMAPTSQCSRR